MRTRQQVAQFAYNGLSPAQFGERTGQSAGQVRGLIAAGWFRRDTDPPEVLDVASVGAKMPTYRIHNAAVERYLAERSQPREYPKREKKAS